MRHMFDVRVILVTLVGDILTQLHPVQLNPVYGSECMCECLFTFSPGFACLVGLCVGVGYGVDGGGAGVAFIVEWTQRTFGHWTLTVECCDTFLSTRTHIHTVIQKEQHVILLHFTEIVFKCVCPVGR